MINDMISAFGGRYLGSEVERGLPAQRSEYGLTEIELLNY